MEVRHEASESGLYAGFSGGGEKIAFAPHQAERFKERSTVERANARLMDEFGVRHERVRGATKCCCALKIDQISGVMRAEN